MCTGTRVHREPTLAVRVQGLGAGESTTAMTLPCRVERVFLQGKGGTGGGSCTLRFEPQEGGNRRIRKMCGAVGCEVTRLHRLSVGGGTC